MTDRLFKAYYFPSFLTFNQITGTLTVNENTISMSDDEGKKLFQIEKTKVINIIDGIRSIKIKTSEKTYNVFFYDNKALTKKYFILTPLLGSSKVMTESQSLCKQVLESMQNAGYPIKISSARST